MEENATSSQNSEPPSKLVENEPPEEQIFFSEKILVGEKKFGAKKPTAQKISKRSDSFRKEWFLDSTPNLWNDWRWQLKNRLRNLSQLEKFYSLSADEKKAIDNSAKSLPFAVTPYYASLIDRFNINQPLRKTVIPQYGEKIHSTGESHDPLEEEHQSPLKNIVHRYPDRVLFLCTNFCSTYCRYCTRSRMVGNVNSRNSCSKETWEEAFKYIESHTEVRDVLISGGDPLTLSDAKISYLLKRLRSIKHVEIIRIGTKVPVVLPQRITPTLLHILKKHHPLLMSIHFTHPEEITEEVKEACTKLADAGIPLGSQTVLLKDVNDDLETMKNLVHGLLKIRVRPYYLYQCDPILGSSHFRTKVSAGLDIIGGLRGYTSGYAVPNFVIDAPGGGGKIPIFPETVKGYKDGNVIIQNYEGKIFQYPEPE